VRGMERDQFSHETAVEQFVDAVIAFSDDPGPANLERYLKASRSLEDSRPPARNRRNAGARPTPSSRVAQGSGSPA